MGWNINEPPPTTQLAQVEVLAGMKIMVEVKWPMDMHGWNWT
jgi:hypothetical protein